MERNCRSIQKLIFLAACVLMIGTASGSVAQQGADLKEIEGLHLQRFDPKTGMKMWDFRAASAIADGDIYRARNPDVIVYGEHDIKIVSGRAVFRRHDNSFDLVEDVVVSVTDPAKTIMRTDKLTWDPEQRVLLTDDLVSVQREGLILTGMGMRLYPGEENELELATLNRNVRMRIEGEATQELVLAPVAGRSENPADDSSPMFISSTGPVAIDRVASKARFEEEVEVKRDGVVITCDSLEVEFDNLTRSVSSISCQGSVRVTEGPNGAAGDTLSWDALSGLCEITGKPAKTWRGQSEVSSDVIWFYEQDRTVIWSGRAHIQAPAEGAESVLRFGGDRQ